MLRKNQKKIFSILVFLALAMFVLTSCFEKNKMKHYTTAQPSGKIRLALRSGIYSSVIKKCLADFEAKTNIYCEVVDLSEDALRSQLLDDASNSCGTYDLCMVDGSWMAEFTARNVLADLSHLGFFLDDDIIPATKSICYKDEKLYLAPYYGNVTVLLYNKLMIREAGYKVEDIDSIEDLLKICDFQKKRHNLGFVYRGDTANNIVVDFLPVLLSRGTYVVDENNNPTVNTYEFREAVHIYKHLIRTGRATKKDDLIAAIANKSAVAGIGWPGWYTPAKNSSMDYIALAGKYREDGEPNNANIYGIWAIGIPSNSTKKELGARLLSYLMDKDVQKTTVVYGGVPCRYSSLSDKEILKKFPQYDAVRKALEGGVYRPVMEEWSQFYTILGRELKLILDGKKSVPDGLSEAQRDLEKMLEASKKK